MTEIKDYVDRLFQHQRLTPEVKDLKEEILSNMLAKRDDLIAQGLNEESASEKAKENLTSIACLIDGYQLTDIGKYQSECAQALLLNSLIFWIFSFPLLFTCYASVSYIGLMLVLIFGAIYVIRINKSTDNAAFLSAAASVRRKKIVWIVWALFFLVFTGTMAALTFGSAIWFGRRLNIIGPYQMANIAVRFYLPLLTIVIPITFSNFTKILLKNKKGNENE